MSIPESFLVVVRCMTFNHHAYIEDAMNGFCMQNTDFPFLCVVMDDCSTDGEQEVIKNYVVEHFNSLITEETDDYVLNLCQHKTNENCYFAVFYLKYNHYSIGKKYNKISYYSKWLDTCKYIALCEGDDYWIDGRKLQMQADFLEKNEDYSMVFHSAIQHWEDGSREDAEFRKLEDRVYKDSEILEVWTIPTASVLFHRKFIQTDFYKTLIKDKRFIYGDIILFLNLCKEGKIYGSSKVMSVYRRHEGGATYGFNLDGSYRQYFHTKAMLDYFPYLKKSVNKVCRQLSANCCIYLVKEKDFYNAKRFFSLSIMTNIFFIPYIVLRKIFR